ncbi:MAG: NAD-dependent deacylase [Candidatus Nezhaarchaeota archaeon]|nr:NAD-dependent deacylase [Candidatus Nezhaarchaeota archaeon]
MDEAIGRVVEMIVASRRAIALTGAGVSTESGIPDFRGPKGLWKRFDPSIGTIDFFREHPDEFWRFQLERAKEMLRAQPNSAHHALAELEALGKIKAVITQNVDGLHFRAGSRNVIEIHGSVRVARCTACGRSTPIEDVLIMAERGLFPPKCRDCGHILKSGTVLFNEPIPVEELEKAYREVESCDLMIIVGTSLQVYPAAHLPVMAKQGGAKLVIINMESTPFDNIADVALRAKAGDTLAAVLEGVKRKLVAVD